MAAPAPAQPTIWHVLSRRGYTLIELAAALGVTAIVAGIGVSTYATLQDAMTQKTAAPMIALVQMETRRLAANDASYQFPDNIVAPITVPGVTVVTGMSSAPSVVSVERSSPTEAVLVAGSPDGCTILVDRLAGRPTWLLDQTKTECAASALADAALAQAPGGTSADPRKVVLN